MTSVETPVAVEAPKTERKLASTQIIESLTPIENADAIEAARVMGWTVVVKKGLYKVGDPCVFFEIDSLLPQIPQFEFMRERKYRVKTIRLRGVLSQGLTIPISEAETIVRERASVAGAASLQTLDENGVLVYNPNVAGLDWTEALGVTKWEPSAVTQANRLLAGNAKGGFPSFLRKTDEDRVQSLRADLLFAEFAGEDVVVTEKADGTSATFYLHEGNFGVCSRNLELKEPAEREITIPNTGEVKRIPPAKSDYWDMSVKYNIAQGLRDNGLDGFSIQGEIVGPGIQANRLALPEKRLLVFNVFNIREGKYLDFSAMLDMCGLLGLETVRVVYRGPFTWESVDELLEFAKGGYSTNPTHPREGIVIRPAVERYSQALRGRASFKVINNEFLEKTGE